MSVWLICFNGHRWESPVDSANHPAWKFCPQCEAIYQSIAPSSRPPFEAFPAGPITPEHLSHTEADVAHAVTIFAGLMAHHGLDLGSGPGARDFRIVSCAIASVIAVREIRRAVDEAPK